MVGGTVANGRRARGRIIDVFALLEGFANLNEKSVTERGGTATTTWSWKPHK